VEVGIGVPADEPNAFSPVVEKGPVHAKPMPQAPPEPCGWWTSAEYLVWWVKQAPVPGPLLTASTSGSGSLTEPGTAVLAGDRTLDYGTLFGGRVSLGYCDPCESWAIEADGFILETGKTTIGAQSNGAGSPVIARPFVDSFTGLEMAALVSAPGTLAGTGSVTATTDLVGAETNFFYTLNSNCRGRSCILIGFRYLQLVEDMQIAQSSTLLPGGTVGFNGASVSGAGTFGIVDDFHTRNDFYGGQVGLQFDYHPGPFFIVATGKVAIGNTHLSAQANGFSSLVTAGGAQTAVGGLLAVPGNIGLASRDEISYVPEVSVTIGVDLCWGIQAFATYHFMYWDDVIRPGDTINRVVNTTFVPTSLNFGTGVGSPPPFISASNHGDFWTQGLSFGLSIRF
jgi:hypothetical protein